MCIEIEPRSLAATHRMALVLALHGLAACGTTGPAVTGNPTITGLGVLASPVLEVVGEMGGDWIRDFARRHRHDGHVSLDDAYQAAFGLSVRSPDVDPVTGRVIHPNPAVQYGVLWGRKTRAVGSMNRAFSHLAYVYGLNALNYGLCQEVLDRDNRAYLLVSVVQLKPGHVSKWLPIDVRPSDPVEWFVPNENTDTVIDWVAIDRSLVDDDKIDAYLLAAAVQSILDGRHAPDYWSVSKQWNSGDLDAVMALSEQRALRMLNATSAHPVAN